MSEDSFIGVPSTVQLYVMVGVVPSGSTDVPVQVIEAVAAVALLGTDAVAVGARLPIPCESDPDTESSPSLTVTSQVTVKFAIRPDPA